MISDISLYQLKNYAEKMTIPFSALNIIYGSNGKGKSTMLQAHSAVGDLTNNE